MRKIMKDLQILLLTCIFPIFILAQDLSEGLIVNDLSLRPMQDIAKPEYLSTIIDPSFGTTIRRITNAGTGEVIVPMYSTVQAWNADESLMILYNQANGTHELMHGMTYQLIRRLDDVNPADLEQIFWDFNNPDAFYYLESSSNDFIKYSESAQDKQILVNLRTISTCLESINMGNDIQMMSWDSDVFSFRCENDNAFSFRISTGELIEYSIDDIRFVAPGVAPSGNRYYHNGIVYDNSGEAAINLNVSSGEHSCLGKLANGNDAYYAIAFAQGPQGGCIGDIIAHDLTTGECIPVISQDQGYDYPQSGTHISSLAHKNTEGGWIAASMIGYDKDGQSLLDQELIIAKAEQGNIKVCRIGHHRSDEDDIDYWGEPHAVISPTGTRVLFGSDWSGSEDGQSIDSYVVELPAFKNTVAVDNLDEKLKNYRIFPNPVDDYADIEFNNTIGNIITINLYNLNGVRVLSKATSLNRYKLDTSNIDSGVYILKMVDQSGNCTVEKIVKR